MNGKLKRWKFFRHSFIRGIIGQGGGNFLEFDWERNLADAELFQTKRSSLWNKNLSEKKNLFD